MSTQFQRVQVKIELGHKATLRKKPTPEGFTHDWVLFVRGPEGCNIQHFVEKVVFYLHETFATPKRVLKEPPYQVAECGYAGFALPIEIYFRNKEEPKKIHFEYDLFLHLQDPPVNHIRCEKLTFQNPTEDFRRKLLKAGGLPVPLPGESPQATQGCSDLFGAPIIKPETPKKHKSSSSSKEKLSSGGKHPHSDHVTSPHVGGGGGDDVADSIKSSSILSSSSNKEKYSSLNPASTKDQKHLSATTVESNRAKHSTSGVGASGRVDKHGSVSPVKEHGVGSGVVKDKHSSKFSKDKYSPSAGSLVREKHSNSSFNKDKHSPGAGSVSSHAAAGSAATHSTLGSASAHASKEHGEHSNKYSPNSVPVKEKHRSPHSGSKEREKHHSPGTVSHHKTKPSSGHKDKHFSPSAGSAGGSASHKERASVKRIPDATSDAHDRTVKKARNSASPDNVSITSNSGSSNNRARSKERHVSKSTAVISDHKISKSSLVAKSGIERVSHPENVHSSANSKKRKHNEQKVADKVSTSKLHRSCSPENGGNSAKSMSNESKPAKTQQHHRIPERVVQKKVSQLFDSDDSDSDDENSHISVASSTSASSSASSKTSSSSNSSLPSSQQSDHKRHHATESLSELPKSSDDDDGDDNASDCSEPPVLSPKREPFKRQDSNESTVFHEDSLSNKKVSPSKLSESLGSLSSNVSSLSPLSPVRSNDKHKRPESPQENKDYVISPLKPLDLTSATHSRQDDRKKKKLEKDHRLHREHREKKNKHVDKTKVKEEKVKEYKDEKSRIMDELFKDDDEDEDDQKVNIKVESEAVPQENKHTSKPSNRSKEEKVKGGHEVIGDKHHHKEHKSKKAEPKPEKDKKTGDSSGIPVQDTVTLKTDEQSIKHDVGKINIDEKGNVHKELSSSEAVTIKRKKTYLDNVTKDMKREVTAAVEPSSPDPAFSVPYLCQLVDIQKKLMSTEDKTILEKVVDLIIESGLYSIGKTTFDFDLCCLDESIIKKIHSCIM